MEGVSLPGFQAECKTIEALRRMPQLRVLILDGAKMDIMLSGFQMPQLALLSWQDADASLLPFALETVKSVAVLDISGNVKLERLPADMQACFPTQC